MKVIDTDSTRTKLCHALPGECVTFPFDDAFKRYPSMYLLCVRDSVHVPWAPAAISNHVDGGLWTSNRHFTLVDIQNGEVFDIPSKSTACEIFRHCEVKLKK